MSLAVVSGRCGSESDSPVGVHPTVVSLGLFSRAGGVLQGDHVCRPLPVSGVGGGDWESLFSRWPPLVCTVFLHGACSFPPALLTYLSVSFCPPFLEPLCCG